MEAKEANPMALDVGDLRDVDRDLLAYLREGRVTPAYARDRMADEEKREVTSTYLGQRLQRLEEHDHVENLYDDGLYELINDPVEHSEIDDAIEPDRGFGKGYSGDSDPDARADFEDSADSEQAERAEEMINQIESEMNTDVGGEDDA